MAEYANQVMLKVKNNADTYARDGRYFSQNLQQATGAATATPSTTGGSVGGPEDDDFDMTKSVIFHATPEVTEVGTAIWVDFHELRGPASISYYMGSPSRNFSISAKLVSRTTAEANKNLRYVNILRSWRMPYIENGGFGTAEPEVLHLFGYGNVFRGIPVIVKSLNIELNSETDYIKSSNNSDVPIIWPVSISLQEIHTINDFDSFKIGDFKKGILPWW